MQIRVRRNAFYRAHHLRGGSRCQGQPMSRSSHRILPNRLPLSVAVPPDVRDPLRDVMLDLIRDKHERYIEFA